MQRSDHLSPLFAPISNCMPYRLRRAWSSWRASGNPRPKHSIKAAITSSAPLSCEIYSNSFYYTAHGMSIPLEKLLDDIGKHAEPAGANISSCPVIIHEYDALCTIHKSNHQVSLSLGGCCIVIINLMTLIHIQTITDRLQNSIMQQLRWHWSDRWYA